MCLPSCGMALRSRSATSGPGRAPASDSRARHGRGSGPSRGPDHGPDRGPSHGLRHPGRLRGRRLSAASTAALRSRADALFEGAPRGAGTGIDAAGARSRVDAGDVGTGAGTGAGTVTAVGADARRWAGLALRERLPMWVQLRCGLEPRTLAALGVVLVVAAVFAAQHFWAGRPQTVRAPELVQQSAASPEPRPSPGVSPSDTGPGGRIVVDVSGKVRRPGCSSCPPDPGSPTHCERPEASGPARTCPGSTRHGSSWTASRWWWADPRRQDPW